LDLVPPAWTRPFDELRRPFMNLLSEISYHPKHWLQHLDQVQHRGSAVLAHLSRLFEQLAAEQAESTEDPDLESLRKPVYQLLSGLGGFPYERLRRKILEFCLNEAIAVPVLAEVIAREPEYLPADERQFAQALLDDWPLRYVCQARQLFWA